MYCPSCGTRNIENAQFCRGCGENISLVPQALTGQMPEKRAVEDDVDDEPYDYSKRRRRRDRTPRLDSAISTCFGGLAFLTISIILGFKGQNWWYWMLIPAFAILGNGIAEYVRYKQAEKDGEKGTGSPGRAKVSAVAPPPRSSALPPRNTAEIIPPPSVTEGTTRHLNTKAEAPTRRTLEREEN